MEHHKTLLQRDNYMKKLAEAVEDVNLRLIFLTWPRDAGKTTLLKKFYDHYESKVKKHYFSFDQTIVSKQFHDLDEFKHYMQIKLGINFDKESILMLNEIQYSKDIIEIIIQLLQDTNVKTKIIATTVYDIPEHILQRVQGRSTCLHVYPLDFFEFLEEKWIHTKYFSLNNFSKIMVQEVQQQFEEYLIWWGYPSVVLAHSQDQKIQALNNIVKKIFEKDAGYRFSKQQLLQFEDIVRLLGYTSGSTFKIKQLEQQLKVSNAYINDYLDFFENNHLFLRVAHFFEDKTREVSHQKKLFCIDTGIVSMLTNTFALKIKTHTAISNFVFQELLINKSQGDVIFTYKKINMSEIDFIIQRADGSLVPVSISHTNSAHPPKMLRWFLELYGDRVSHWIKLCPLHHDHIYHDRYTLHIIPRCMTKQLYTLL